MSHSRKKLTTEEFLDKVLKVHGNKYDYSKVNYKLSREKVVIICSIHGDFKTTPNNLLNGAGCKKCGLIKQGLSRRKTQEDFIKNSVKTHENKYDYSKVIYKTCKDKIEIICKIHGSFMQSPNAHLKAGCRLCGIKSISEKLKLSPEDFLKRAYKTHGELYNYNEVKYTKIHDKITIGCKTHGYFQQDPSAHIQGQGCPKCALIVIGVKKTKGFSSFLAKAIKTHKNLYEYVEESYTKASENLKIICPIHGVFTQIGSSHLSGAGCKKCGVNKRTNSRKIGLDKFLELANLKYGFLYDYSKFEYVNTDTKSIFICQKHGEFEQTPYNHLKAKIACRKCSKDCTVEMTRKLPKELGKLKKNFSKRAKLFLRKNEMINNKKGYVEILGCDWITFKSHLENNPFNFKVGCPDLDLDHIVPICESKTENDFYKLNHYSNFQLLPSVYNQHIKRAKPFDKEHFKSWLIKTSYNKC